MGIMLVLWILLKIACILVAVLLSVAYFTYAERKVLAYMQARLGPNRVGPLGLWQPFADLIKMLNKEIIVPTQANKFLFIVAPIVSITTALIAWAVIPINDRFVLANINPAMIYVFAVTSLGIYGILIAGWAANSKYALLGALRSAAQSISYEIAMGLALVGVMIASNSVNFTQIVLSQGGGIWHWWFIPLFPLFIVYCISGVAETNRSPFDVAEGESEIVAGFHVEYSGMTFALFYLAEYANMLLVCALATLLFMGGWLSPFQHIPVLDTAFAWVPQCAWFFLKMGLFAFMYLWIRATFPRYRYDQIMRLGWKVLIPLTLIWIVVVAIAAKLMLPPWFG